jgi:hypothetical protein
MPGVSQKYPPERRDHILPNVQSVGELSGVLVNPNTGDVTVSAVARRQIGIVAFLWDALGFLDIIDQQQAQFQQQAAAQNAQLSVLQQGLLQLQSQLQALQANMDTVLSFMGVWIPLWTVKSDVLTGISFLTGIPVPTAASLGLIIEFVPSGTVGGLIPGSIIRIEPPAGTFVPRGSTVKIVYDD